MHFVLPSPMKEPGSIRLIQMYAAMRFNIH